MNVPATDIPKRPPFDSSTQVLDVFIVNAATVYALMNQNSSIDIKDKQLREWHDFFRLVFREKLRYYESFLCCGAHNAQNLIDMTQTDLSYLVDFAPQFLHLEWVDERFKSILEVACLRLAQIYQLLPKTLLLNDILHPNALLTHNHAAVKGTHKGRVVSVRVSGSRSETSILDVALGMSYLHDNGVVHGRIHGKNVLVTDTKPLRARLSDFGLAPVHPAGPGAAPFLAPELNVPNPPYPTKASDVYAFSTTTYEILKSSETKGVPWSNPFEPDNSGIDELTWLILLDSWKADPANRPTAGLIVERLEKTIKTREMCIERLKSVFNIIFSDKEYYNTFLACKGEDAQEVLDIFQLLLDTDKLFYLRLEDHRNQLVVAMRRLSVETELYPSRFLLDCPLPTTADTPVALGGFADVYKVKINPPNHDICVKVIRVMSSLSSRMVKVYAREVIYWGQLSHPNILPFYGLLRLGSRLCLVSPWANNGNLTDYLKNNPQASRVLLCLDMAAGVEYLHANHIVHGDLKGVKLYLSSMDVSD
ncbi:hypothetical protein C0992_000455 [Termitomyces sp. T32_za158]|nr:hypothetical protein C0992_000455 [Termitomyces sp. T32_za158]